MNIRRWKQPLVIAAAAALLTGAALAVTLRNRLSDTTIIGHWQGYGLSQNDVGGRRLVTKDPLGFTFRPDGLVIRDGNLTQANYQVGDSALVFYHIRSRNAPSHPVLWNARLVGDTLTLSGSEPVAVLRRIQ